MSQDSAPIDLSRDIAVADELIATIQARIGAPAPAAELKDLVVSLSRAMYWRRGLVRYADKGSGEPQPETPEPTGPELSRARQQAAKLRRE